MSIMQRLHGKPSIHFRYSIFPKDTWLCRSSTEPVYADSKNSSKNISKVTCKNCLRIIKIRAGDGLL